MYYKTEYEFKCGEACIQKFVLTGAESIPDVDVGKKRYALNIILPSSDETGEIRLVFENVSRQVWRGGGGRWPWRVSGVSTCGVMIGPNRCAGSFLVH
jgi:hypothetical protein